MTLWRCGLFVTFLLFEPSIPAALPNVILEGRGGPQRHLLMEDDLPNNTNTTGKTGQQQEEH